MDYSQVITIEPGKRSGKPCIRNTRMTVVDVLEYVAGGMTQDELLADFPDLTPEDILEAKKGYTPFKNRSAPGDLDIFLASLQHRAFRGEL